MKIIAMRASNVKKLKAIEILHPDQSMVVVTGKNGAGKSSLLDAIWLAIGGGDAAKQVGNVIREGESEASAMVELPQLTITRTWKRRDDGITTTKLSVKNKDGAAFQSPQAILDALTGSVAFDPLEFIRLSQKDQVATMLRAIGAEAELKAVDAEYTKLYEERTDVNRRARDLQGQLEGLAPQAEVPEAVDSEALMQTLNEATQTEARISAHTNRIQLEESKRDGLADQRVRLMKQIEELDNRMAILATEIETQQTMLSAIPKPDAEVVAAAREQLRQADTKNAARNAIVSNNQRRDVIGKQHVEAVAKASELTTKLEALDGKKRQRILDSSLPVPGVAFDGNGVTFEGRPLRDCSSAEQLRVSIAIAIALNPKLRVLRIADGSLLDSDGLQIVRDMATMLDFQVWIERVDDPTNGTIVIEEGEIV